MHLYKSFKVFRYLVLDKKLMPNDGTVRQIGKYSMIIRDCLIEP